MLPRFSNKSSLALLLVSLLSVSTTTEAFLDCTNKLGHNPELEDRLCEHSATWCSSAANHIPIVFDFSEFNHRSYVHKLEIPLAGYENKHIPVAAFGNALPYYTPNEAGVNVQGGAPRILDTARPDEDPDLGTPNQASYGPGEGVGGVTTNTKYWGHAMFIQERQKKRVDDTVTGGSIKFDFSNIHHCLTILKVGLLDMDEDTLELTAPTEPNVMKTGVYSMGDNSFQEVTVQGGGNNMEWLNLELAMSGALVYMKGCIAKDPVM